MSFDGHKHAFLSRKGVELLCHCAVVCLALVEIARPVSKAVGPIYTTTNRVGEFQSFLILVQTWPFISVFLVGMSLGFYSHSRDD